ncbi:MAG: peroxiredoxin [Candidatus Micrarchaeota archaeon]|nr:peroxiredoxin [Candidatus Micrarchaeota archaeon]
MLEVNSAAPSFTLKGSDGKEHSLRDFKGKYLVLYFYPRDDTMGCTIEAKGFTAKLEEIRKLGADVVGVSNDDLASHDKFCNKYGLRVLLLSDTKNKVIKAYEAYGNKGVFGWGTIRKTYVIGRDGKILKVYNRVQPVGHEKEVISFLKDVSS